MKKAVGIIVLLGVVAAVLNCASDVYLGGKATIEGVYEGLYTIVINDTTYQQVVLWEFTKEEFYMDIDKAKPVAESLQCICNYSGKYDLGEKVRLKVVGSADPPGSIGNLSCTSCDDNLSPEGSYDLFRPADSLILRYELEGTSKEIILLPMSPESTAQVRSKIRKAGFSQHRVSQSGSLH